MNEPADLPGSTHTKVTRRLPVPPAFDPEASAAWVAGHLGDLAGDGAGGIRPSPRFRGGQGAADAVLATLDVTGYAATRSEVWPLPRRGATGVSPYVRYGLVTLPQLWAAVAGAPPRDREKYRDELLWQEYARHLYARLGPALSRPLRAEPPHHVPANPPTPGGRSKDPGLADPWDRRMACMDLAVGELERDGWLVNQVRMWLASQWSVRAGADWRVGEDRFFAHLLDGSRAANRAGWQWTVGTATGRPYGFSRWQVERRAPGLCGRCPLANACPVQDPPETPELSRVDPDPRLRSDPDPQATAGPRRVEPAGRPDTVWLTAESLGDVDPALAANPGLPAVFVFDAPLLARLRLSGKRLVFLAETLADLAVRYPLEVWRGDPAEVLAGRRLAVTFTPVPGWRRLAARLDPVELHPWPWLRRPHGGPAGSFSAWRKVFPRR